MESISVIIPAYNAGKYIAEAIGSVRAGLDETLGAPELIVVSDGSTDDTAAVAAGLGARVIEKPRGGAASARNAGLAAASGSLIAFLDADDVYVPGALSALYRALCESGARAVFALAEDFISPELTPSERAPLRPRPGPYGGMLPGSSLLRRELFETLGPFDESLRSGETVQWMIRLRDAGIKTAQLGQVTLRRRLHMTNTGRTEREQEMKNYAAILRRRARKAGPTSGGA